MVIAGVLGVVAVACGRSGSGDRSVGTTNQATVGSTSIPVGSSVHDIDVDGTRRTFRTYRPADLDPSRPVPLVVMLHGGFGSALQAEADYGWDAEADTGRFVVVYPDGQRRAWNAGTCCGEPARDDVDDVRFVTGAVAAVGRSIPIDPRRVFVAGMSNGAMMAERLACETTTFAAVASVAGAQMVTCEGAAPISVLHIHGTADHHVPMDGSPGEGIGRVPVHTPVGTSIDRWRVVDGCGRPTVTAEGTVTTSVAECPSGRAVALITVDGAGHQWPGASKRNSRMKSSIGADPPSTAIDATDAIWEFFAAHPAPVQPSSGR